MNDKIQPNKWGDAKCLTSEQDVTEFLETSMREGGSMDDDSEVR
ncbi:hypothetical protein GA0061078_1420 [Bifidobacterium bohemicum]|uniref:Uncharacterized protein n=1 Tax=Bifidobacterium bohemicum DSM 22767 TaxID=1437606 RepID=A0A086ZGW1_9BIFI|nr:hypothetical protein [Bifidobacterium bohemicum]KFI45761.1 hypothetical protein BBOH_0563 [Bifidobacterium bohemicum DSM 22767]SCC08814.1 hypothetical protein GA0061078_1420 [Bifidobacterium bohemicum]